MRGYASISPIYRQAPDPTPDPDWEQWSRIERLRRQAWLQSGVVAVIPAELPDHLRSAIETWAEQQYGQRRDAI